MVQVWPTLIARLPNLPTPGLAKDKEHPRRLEYITDTAKRNNKKLIRF